MSSLRYIVYTLAFSLIAVLAGFSVNYLIDPYSVFGAGLFPEYGQPQERYLKIEYLKRNPDFNTFLIGSSRIGTVRTEIVDEHIPGAKSYNLTISQANQWDVEKHIDWLVENIPNLTHIVVQVDWITGYGPDRPNYALLDEIHPDLSGRSKYAFLLDYLTLFNLEGITAKIDANRGDADVLKYDVTKGYWSRPLRDMKIEADCENYVANEKEFNWHKIRSAPVKADPANLTDALASIARYKSLLDAKNIKLTILLTPQNHHALDPIDIEDYQFVIRKLANITDFYNFMYYSGVTKNDCNYYETSHYRPLVGELIVRSIAEKPGKQSVVYQYVSKKTVAAHLEFIKKNFASERSSGI